MKKNKFSKNWVVQKNRDLYYIKSKSHGFRSRSAFKLVEMNKKFKLFKKNLFLLDLGSFPGGWSQVASQEITQGKILAVDIKLMEKIDRVDFIQGDFCNTKVIDNIKDYFNNKIDIVISDMAANTTGNKTLDSYRTGELCLNAMHLAKKVLPHDGVFLSKLFMGTIFNEINEVAKKNFRKTTVYKPLSSKKESKEIYIYCKGLLKA